MTRDVETLIHYLRIALWLGSIFTTLFCVLYAFSGWWKYLLGRILMLEMFAFALAMDYTLLQQYWVPGDIFVLFWTELAVFSLIAIGSAAMCFKMVQLNWRVRKGTVEDAHTAE